MNELMGALLAVTAILIFSACGVILGLVILGIWKWRNDIIRKIKELITDA